MCIGHSHVNVVMRRRETVQEALRGKAAEIEEKENTAREIVQEIGKIKG